MIEFLSLVDEADYDHNLDSLIVSISDTDALLPDLFSCFWCWRHFSHGDRVLFGWTQNGIFSALVLLDQAFFHQASEDLCSSLAIILIPLQRLVLSLKLLEPGQFLLNSRLLEHGLLLLCSDLPLGSSSFGSDLEHLSSNSFLNYIYNTT